MKVNEAPEKIYLQKYDTDTLLCLNRYNIHEEWTERPVCANSATGNDIEYTRTDAFIEKACSWLKNNLQGVVGGNIYIDDFRKYMKGELQKAQLKRKKK